MVIAVPAGGGAVYAQCGDSIVMLGPEDVSRLRKAFQEAQQVALQDQGIW